MSTRNWILSREDIDGCGVRARRLYFVPVRSRASIWASVTNVACPSCGRGRVRWAEAGYVPGYRICDCCHRHFLTRGTAAKPALLTTGRKKAHW